MGLLCKGGISIIAKIMLKFKSLTIKNFLSIGNITQSIRFNDRELVLILGENIDLGGNDNRNGVGKSAIVNALSYALYGEALTRIRKDNLINVTNLKQMLVTLKFDAGSKSYTIERGRKPNIFKFSEDGIFVDAGEGAGIVEIDESQGEGRHTQIEIERILSISHDMFKHLVAMNTYVEPFLALRTNDQRIIIEQLLGITKLSEKAEKLKEEARINKDAIKEEEFRINAANEANKRIEQNINGLEIKSKNWDLAKAAKIEKIQSAILDMLNVNIDNEISLHKTKKEVEDLTAEYRSLFKELTSLEKDVSDTKTTLVKIRNKLANSTEKICPTCSQEMDKDTHADVHADYLAQCSDTELKLREKTAKRDEVKTLATSVASLIPKIPSTFYSAIDDAYSHKTTLDTLGNSLSTELETVNPYTEQIVSLRTHGIQEIDFTVMNEIVKLRDHHEFLLKLLTNKDSFIRKKIIDQNLTYLNHRLAHYLTEIGLPHQVKFKSDLEVEISMYGKEFDFDNLSRGERTRLILSLSWTFRDVFESTNGKVNLLFIDELLDNGTDSAGIESTVTILKAMARDGGRNIFLISHRDECISRISDTIKIVKENGFTSIEST